MCVCVCVGGALFDWGGIDFDCLSVVRFCFLLHVYWLPHEVLWLLKSPRRMKGLVSCLVWFTSSISLICSCGGMYTEWIVIVLCSVTCIGVLALWEVGFVVCHFLQESMCLHWPGVLYCGCSDIVCNLEELSYCFLLRKFFEGKW